MWNILLAFNIKKKLYKWNASALVYFECFSKSFAKICSLMFLDSTESSLRTAEQTNPVTIKKTNKIVSSFTVLS